jgi:hypothetical protein
MLVFQGSRPDNHSPGMNYQNSKIWAKFSAGHGRELLPERLIMLRQDRAQRVADPGRADPLTGPRYQQRRAYRMPALPRSLGHDRQPRLDLGAHPGRRLLV